MADRERFATGSRSPAKDTELAADVEDPEMWYSLWLSPSDVEEPHLFELLRKEIESDAARFGRKAWIPHITLATNIRGPEDQVIEKAPINVAFQEVCHKPSGIGIWCDVDECGEQAYNTAAEVFGYAYGEMPGPGARAAGRIARPRMSMLYSVLDPVTGAQERDRLQARLFGTPISRSSDITEDPEPSGVLRHGTEGKQPSSTQHQQQDQQHQSIARPSNCLGALSHSSLGCSSPRQSGLEYTHTFHAMHLWETPVLPLDDPTMQTWRHVLTVSIPLPSRRPIRTPQIPFPA